MTGYAAASTSSKRSATTRAVNSQKLEKTLISQPEPDVDLLDALPILAGVNIADAPEGLQRRLYDALRLKIGYDRPDQARFRLTLTDDTVDALTLATTGTAAPEPESCAHATATPPGAHSLVDR